MYKQGSEALQNLTRMVDIDQLEDQKETLKNQFDLVNDASDVLSSGNLCVSISLISFLPL